ncbi:MAG: arginine--tRNA ligase [Candidatus Woesearchaeota archaeon]
MISEIIANWLGKFLREKYNRKISSDVLNKMISKPQKRFGDFCINSFLIARELNESNEIVGKSIVFELQKENPGWLERAEFLNGYINIFLNKSYFGKSIILGILKEKEEKEKKTKRGENKKRKKRIIIEHTSINPSGPVNVGRIRNSFIGDTLVRVYKELGFKVRAHYYVNDVGKQVAIIAWAKKNNIEEDESLKEKFKDYADRPDFKTMFIYVPAYKIISTNQEHAKEVEELIKLCELGEKKNLSLMRETAEYCLEGQKKTLERFNIRFDSFDFESALLENNKTQEFIEKLKKLKEYKVVNGNHVLDFEKYGFKSRFGGIVFQRANGTSVYLSRDVAYHAWKKTLADKMINVLGEDHKVEFKVLKQVLKLLRIIKRESEFEVVHFSFVGLKEGKLSTRVGRIIPADHVLDEGKRKVISIMGEKIQSAEREETAEKIASSAIRYFELRINPEKQIVFDWDSALSFEGQTGPYLQYALVRAKKIILKSGLNEDEIRRIARKVDYSRLNTDEEKDLIIKMDEFKEVLEQTALKNSPHILANYAYELATSFTNFYEKVRVIGEEEDLRNARVILVLAFAILFKKVISILGLQEVEEM